MKKTYRYKLNLTDKQKNVFEQFFGSVRFIFNWGLDKKIKSFEQSYEPISFFKLVEELPSLKNSEKTSFLNDCPDDCLIESLKNLESASANFFKKANDYPKFKSKKHSKSVCRFTKDVSIDFEHWTMRFPYIYNNV